jgi:predicted dehydrogenase
VRELAPGAALVDTLDQLLDRSLDGVVIATPSALHAEQSLQALARRVAVFCQKPLARTAQETRAILDAARKADRLLGCDLSYRHTEAMRRIRNCVVEGDIGACTPSTWCSTTRTAPTRAGPATCAWPAAVAPSTWAPTWWTWRCGCSGSPGVQGVTSQLYAHGKRLPACPDEVEDFAVAQVELAGGAVVRLACSWEFSGGTDAVIEAHFHGSRGGASMRNRNGSFFDFVAERHHGTQRTLLAEPPDDWGGRAVVDWARRLGAGARYESGIESLLDVATVLDRHLWTVSDQPTVLLTADTVGGVWTYAAELSRDAGARGIDVHLATMGAPVRAHQRQQVAGRAGITLHESDWKLEWMPDGDDAVDLAGAWLLDLERRWCNRTWCT